MMICSNVKMAIVQKLIYRSSKKTIKSEPKKKNIQAIF